MFQNRSKKCWVFSKIFVVRNVNQTLPLWKLWWCSGNVVTCFSDIFLIISHHFDLLLLVTPCHRATVPPCHHATLHPKPVPVPATRSYFRDFQVKSLKWEFAKKTVRMKKSICLYRDCSLSKNCDNFSSITLTGFTFTLFLPQPLEIPNQIVPPRSQQPVLLKLASKLDISVSVLLIPPAQHASRPARDTDWLMENFKENSFFFPKLVFYFLTKMNKSD